MGRRKQRKRSFADGKESRKWRAGEGGEGEGSKTVSNMPCTGKKEPQ